MSTFSILMRFLGSVRLAVPLLGAIAVILIWATTYEAQVGSETVQQVVYKSPWFGALMALLALNLTVSTLWRYPWRGARKVGFALTHLGLIILIAGSAAVIHLGLEGMLWVRTDAPPNSIIRLEGARLDVAQAGEEPQQATLTLRTDHRVTPRQVGVFTLLDYTDHAAQTVDFKAHGPISNPAVQLRLTSRRMGQGVERWLAASPFGYQQQQVGPAQLELVQAPDAKALKSALQAPKPQSNPALGTITLATAQSETRLVLHQKSGQTLRLGPITARVTGFWPDFRLDEQHQPFSASDQLLNPAVQLDVSDGKNRDRWFLFGQAEPLRTVITGTGLPVTLSYAPPAVPAANFFRVIAGPDHQWFYAAQSKNKGFQSGSLAVGQTVQPGWADFEVTLTQALTQAQIQRQVQPVANPDISGEPALLVQTPDGTQQWLPWNQPTAIATPGGDYFAAFGPRLMTLPFTVALDDFIVERNEGSDSVAMWTSQIQIQGPPDAEPLQRNVWMNHPTWYQGWSKDSGGT